MHRLYFKAFVFLNSGAVGLPFPNVKVQIVSTKDDGTPDMKKFVLNVISYNVEHQLKLKI